MISSRLKIVLLATIFNLSFEYSLRGPKEFLSRPLQTIFLFGAYFTLYTMLEDLIVRFKLKDYQLALGAMSWGIAFPMTLALGNVFLNPQFLGINWLTLLFVGVLWWGILQAIFTFYFANRLIKRDWDHPRLGKIGWIFCLAYNIVGFGLIRIKLGSSSPVDLGAYLLIYLIVAGLLLFLWQDLKRNRLEKIKPFEKSKVMDFLVFGSLILFSLVGTFLPAGQEGSAVSLTRLNLLALKIIVLWTFFYSFIFFTYKIFIFWLLKKRGVNYK